jgi:adenylylsulfate kinase
VGIGVKNGMNTKYLVLPKGKVSYEDRCRNLIQNGLVIWFTGLSGSGKSTIASEVEKELVARKKAVYWLDGDSLRCGLNSDLGFSEQDRKENIRRLAEVAALFKDAGIIVLVSAISPFQEMRDFARIKAGGSGLIEVYVKADITTCEKRDPKGLYMKARTGEIMNFTGISSPYEEPENPDLVIDTDVLSIEESVKLVLKHIANIVEFLITQK